MESAPTINTALLSDLIKRPRTIDLLVKPPHTVNCEHVTKTTRRELKITKKKIVDFHELASACGLSNRSKINPRQIRASAVYECTHIRKKNKIKRTPQ